MSIRLRSLLYLLLAVLAAGALSACGGGEAGGEKASASTDVDQLLKETFSGEKKVDSGTIGLKLVVDAKGAEAQGVSGPITFTLGGPIQGLEAKTLPRFKLDAAFSGAGQNIKAGATSTGKKAFVNFSNEDYAVSDQVFKQLKAGYEEAQKSAGKQQNGTSLATLGIDARKWLTNPSNEGDAKVGGDDAIKITGGVDVPKLLDDVNVALSKASSLGLQNTGQLPQKLTDAQRTRVVDAVKDLKVEIYTGKADKILRRMVVDADLAVAKSGSQAAQSAVIKLDFSLTGVNQDVKIDAPDKTKPFDELLGQLGALGSLGGSSGSGSGSGGTSRAELKDYTDCITKAGSDVTAAQECAKLLTP